MSYQVLLVEDDSQIREVIEDFFAAREDGKIQIISAGDGFEGLDAVYEKEYVPEYDLGSNLPYTVEKTDAHVFTVEGPRIEKMLGYTNLDSEKGFTFFQRFLKETGILKELEDLGIEDGDTVKMYGQHFDYYHE